jgi:hypothetical protein
MRTSGFIPRSFQQSLETHLADIEDAITEVQGHYRKHADVKLGKMTRLRWAVADSSLIRKNEHRILTGLAYFNMILQLVAMYVFYASARLP